MATSEALAARYGRRRPESSRRRLVIAGAVAVAVFLVWAVPLAWRTTNRPATWTLAGLTVLSATRSTVDFDITLAPGHTAVCRVRVMNSRSTVVGWSDVTVTAGPTARSQRQTAEITTAEPGDQGSVQTCLVQ
jgi:hypothetical protein